MTFEDDLAAEFTAAPKFKDVDVLLNGTLHTIRFFQLDGTQWANIVDGHPARPGKKLDEAFGYDIRGVSREVAPLTGYRVAEDGEPAPIASESWGTLYKSLGGGALSAIDDAIFALNEMNPRQEVIAARKALAGQPALSSISPSDSESHPDA